MENPVEIIIQEIRHALREEADRIIEALRPEPAPTYPGLAGYVTLKKASEELGVSDQTLWNHRKKIGCTKQFGQIFFLREAIVRYIESGRQVEEKKEFMYTKYTRRKSEYRPT